VLCDRPKPAMTVLVGFREPHAELGRTYRFGQFVGQTALAQSARSGVPTVATAAVDPGT
jgi:hypothetical protein